MNKYTVQTTIEFLSKNGNLETHSNYFSLNAKNKKELIDNFKYDLQGYKDYLIDDFKHVFKCIPNYEYFLTQKILSNNDSIDIYNLDFSKTKEI